MKTFKNKTKSVRFFAFLFVSIIFTSQISAQSCYNELVDTMISKISLQGICKIVHELTGDTSTIIGGEPYTILTRAWEYPGNQMAAQYIFEKFSSFGYTPRYQTYSATGKNVIAVKTGIKYPNKHYIVCGHYDSYPFAPRSIGADDDATGVCGVLEAARIMAPYDFDYTVIFVALDEEERWLFGSGAYADTALLRGDSIMNVINLDMTAYDANHDNKLRIITNAPSIYYANAVCSAFLLYQPLLDPIVVNDSNFGASDHYAFWERGFKAVWPFEGDVNPNVNSMRDTITWFNYDYFLKFTRGAVASLIVLAKDYIINIAHETLQNTYDTTSRVVTAVITSNHPIARNWISKRRDAPRLYWKAGNGSFSWRNAYHSNLDTFKFSIPGYPLGTTVFYYLTAQDSLGTMVSSQPGGAKGIGPPGTIPPPRFYSYSILKQLNVCSNGQKILLPRQITYDTINVQENGTVHDYNLNLTIYHTNDSDLYIWLMRPGETMIQLSTGNGRDGDNYFNTTFDDEADIPITQGTPPFIGSFRPEMPLSRYDVKQIQGEWIVRIYNYSQTVSGQLVNWCLNFVYYDPIGIVNNQIPVKNSLCQNFPNPFNASTKISFSLEKKSHVRVAVYDILGREVTVLGNGVYSAGDYNFSFNADNYASGIYFYTMYLDGNLFDTKKMALIK